MSVTILKAFNAVDRINDIGFGKYMARVLKHYGFKPDLRFLIVRTIKTVTQPITLFKSYNIASYVAGKPSNLSISKETHVLHVPDETLSGVRELVSCIGEFYSLNRNKIIERSEGTYAYLIKLLKTSSDSLDEDERALLHKILKFAAQPTLMGLAAEYIGQIPVIHSYSLTRTGVVDPKVPYSGSQLFHRDVGEKKLIHLIICLSKTDKGDGPFTYIDAVSSKRIMKKLGHQAGRVSDKDVADNLNEGKIIEIVGGPGKVVFVNPERCFHYGARNQQGERLTLIISYAPPNEAVEGSTALYIQKYKKEFDLSKLSTPEKRLLKIY
jgi:hypothetical protein